MTQTEPSIEQLIEATIASHPKPTPVSSSDYDERWRESIIGRLEKELITRLRIGPYWARGASTALVSSALYNAYTYDEMGPVRPNLFFVYIARSGFGIKSPAIDMIRDITIKFQKSLIVGKFTTAGFTQRVIGRTITEPNGTIREVPPNPNAFILRDEISKLTKEANITNYSEIPEFLSECWNGWIESNHTRTYGFEEGKRVYVSMLTAGTEYFLSLLDQSYFVQGLGNRPYYVREDPPPPVKKDPDTFFSSGAERRDAFIDEMVKQLNSLTPIKKAELDKEARDSWAEYEFKLKTDAQQSGSLQACYLQKTPLNCLKLSMVYAASRLDFAGEVLHVRGDDMRQSITDSNVYLRMFGEVVEWWQKLRREGQIERASVPSLYNINTVAKAAEELGGIFTVGDIMRVASLPNRNSIRTLIDFGIEKGWFEQCTNKTGEQGTLTAEEYAIVKRRIGRGTVGIIYRITEAGRKREEVKL